MKINILTIDWLLIVVFVLMIISKFIKLPFTNAIQPIFFILIITHIAQHWKILVRSLKKLNK